MSASTSVTPMFARGLSALEAGRNQEAIEAFQAAYAADGNPAALMNLGIAYTNEGMLNHAVETLKRFTERADVVRDAESIAAVQAEIARIRSNNGVVVVHISPADAALQVDGRMLSPVDGELVIAPGQRRFVVFAQGHVTYDQVMAVAVGRFSFDVSLTPVSAAPVQVPAEPAAAVAQPASALVAPEIVEPDDDEPKAKPVNCALSSVCFGPVLSLVGPPNLFGGGLHFRLGDYFGAGVDYQMTPEIGFRPVAVSTSLFSVNARVYPFANSFFLGGGFGYQEWRGRFTDQDVRASAIASFPAMMASIGFMGRAGFVMGMDLAVMIPLGSSKVEIDRMQIYQANGMPAPQEMIDHASAQVRSGLTKVLDAMPFFAQVNLLRLGYLF